MSLFGKMKKVLPLHRMSDNLYQTMVENQHRILEEFNIINNKLDFFFWLNRSTEEDDSEVRKKVFLSMPKARGSLRLAQIGSYLILERIKMICDKKGIDFFIQDGTLLGAVRHNGFIPWDDDIDIGVQRKDFNRFCLAINEDEFIEIKTYYNIFKQVINKVKFSFSDCFWVDVFIWEAFDASNENIKERIGTIRERCSLFNSEFAPIIEASFINSNAFSITNKSLDIKLEELLNKYTYDLDYYGEGHYYCGSIYNPLVFWDTMECKSYSEFYPLRDDLYFEKTHFKSFNEYEKVLVHQYGDIYEFPYKMCGHLDTGNNIEKEFKKLIECGLVKNGDYLYGKD